MKQNNLESLNRIVSIAFIIILFLLLNHFDWGAGFARGIVLIIIFGLVYSVFRQNLNKKKNETNKIILLIIIVILLVLQTVFFIQNIDSAPIDIGTTTVTAIDIFWNRGLNPYSYSIDKAAESVMSSSKYFIGGYKYLPTTFFIYSPLVLLFGNKGIYITNFIFYLLVLVVLYKTSQKIHKDRGITLITLILYLSAYLITFELFIQGVNDLIPIFFILLAYYFLLKNREGLSGIFLGLSLTSKWLPTPIFLVLLIPAVRNKKRFLLIALGVSLVILLPFIYLDFIALIGSLIFPLSRPGDSTSFLFGLNPYVVMIIRGLFLAGIFLLLGRAYSRINFRNKEKIAFFYSMILILVLLILGQNHRNYQIWLIPFLCLCLANFLLVER